ADCMRRAYRTMNSSKAGGVAQRGRHRLNDLVSAVFLLAPARIPLDPSGLEGLRLEAMVLDADDPSASQGEDVEDLPPQRLAIDVVECRTSDTHHHPIACADELERRHIPALLESLLQCVDDLIGPVADPPLAKTLPCHIGV